ncbi:alpha/beta fold hydrolase [Natrialbaceae archaeon AArc-T1-2]|uniref:alpha/beta fold hydrolase n=1 Tax=Natrialbaceae archaeon AArc-T1-2 TaxID=3053904 RepID=UPI00255B01F1|nr:alpha/beta hydrolase [Natrialbaceae archaeon AArc-T1-2]WIV66218.1 alpha/beta hydrolase [Natrialbaceae archaeon AArc-T1-2]
METISHLGRTTAYAEADRGGDRPSLLFVHGSGASNAVWKSQHRLADRFPVAALDLSGHGESDDIDASPGYTTLDAYADDVLAVAEETDAQVLVGNSLGGAVVMHLLLERGYAPDAVVLTGTGARLGVLEDLLQWLESDFERALAFLHEDGRLFHDPDPQIRELSIERMRETGQDVTHRDFLTCHRFDIRDRLGAIDVPVLAIYGEHDRLTPPWYHEFIVENVADGTLVEVDDAAHLAMLERPDAFNDAVATFLDSRV